MRRQIEVFSTYDLSDDPTAAVVTTVLVDFAKYLNIFICPPQGLEADRGLLYVACSRKLPFLRLFACQAIEVLIVQFNYRGISVLNCAIRYGNWYIFFFPVHVGNNRIRLTSFLLFLGAFVGGLNALQLSNIFDFTIANGYALRSIFSLTPLPITYLALCCVAAPTKLNCTLPTPPRERSINCRLGLTPEQHFKRILRPGSMAQDTPTVLAPRGQE